VHVGEHTKPMRGMVAAIAEQGVDMIDHHPVDVRQ